MLWKKDQLFSNTMGSDTESGNRGAHAFSDPLFNFINLLLIILLGIINSTLFMNSEEFPKVTWAMCVLTLESHQRTQKYSSKDFEECIELCADQKNMTVQSLSHRDQKLALKCHFFCLASLDLSFLLWQRIVRSYSCNPVACKNCMVGGSGTSTPLCCFPATSISYAWRCHKASEAVFSRKPCSKQISIHPRGSGSRENPKREYKVVVIVKLGTMGAGWSPDRQGGGGEFSWH